jgi:hypothetical protein
MQSVRRITENSKNSLFLATYLDFCDFSASDDLAGPQR